MCLFGVIIKKKRTEIKKILSIYPKTVFVSLLFSFLCNEEKKKYIYILTEERSKAYSAMRGSLGGCAIGFYC